MIIVDDPINPKQAVSEVELASTNDFMDRTLPSRKVDKSVVPTIMIMQRVAEDDPTGHWLDKGKKNVKHICLPAECKRFGEFVKPAGLKRFYADSLLDPKRMGWNVLTDMEADLGQYGYAGQFGQNPVPPEGGMFRPDNMPIIDVRSPKTQIVMTVRYWDKAATKSKGGKIDMSAKFTCGIKMSKLTNGKYLVEDEVRGQWGTDEREDRIRKTAEADGPDVFQYHEQEPGSSGKDSAEATTRNLAGFVAVSDRPTGDKIQRADTYSVQVNSGNVMMLRAEWNKGYKHELRLFPFGKFKDRVDASSGAFNKLAAKRLVRRIY
jgi:predicted phage terminase large subunit-like protein